MFFYIVDLVRCLEAGMKGTKSRLRNSNEETARVVWVRDEVLIEIGKGKTEEMHCRDI